MQRWSEQTMKGKKDRLFPSLNRIVPLPVDKSLTMLSSITQQKGKQREVRECGAQMDIFFLHLCHPLPSLSTFSTILGLFQKTKINHSCWSQMYPYLSCAAPFIVLPKLPATTVHVRLIRLNEANQ